MAISIFRAFRSTVTPSASRRINSNDTWLTDPTTGVVIGVQNQNANGADARFTPVDITVAQSLSPSARMLADIDATYRLNIAPYSRFISDGTQLVPLGNSSETAVVVPAGFNQLFLAPLTIATPQELIVEGGVRVQ